MKKIVFLLALVITGCSSWTLQNENHRFNDFLDAEFEKALENSPESYTYLGIKKKYDQLNNNSEEFALKMQEERKLVHNRLAQFDSSQLNAETQLSYRLAKKGLEEQIADFHCRRKGASGLAIRRNPCNPVLGHRVPLGGGRSLHAARTRGHHQQQ